MLVALALPRGHICATSGGVLDKPDPEGKPVFQIFVLGWTAHGWFNAKKAFSFARLFNDGDDEGSSFLARLPTSDEASIIRHYVGIAKKAEYGEETLTARRHWASEWSKNSPSVAAG